MLGRQIMNCRIYWTVLPEGMHGSAFVLDSGCVEER